MRVYGALMWSLGKVSSGVYIYKDSPRGVGWGVILETSGEKLDIYTFGLDFYSLNLKRTVVETFSDPLFKQTRFPFKLYLEDFLQCLGSI